MASKQDDHYSFSYEFEYIEKNHGNDQYDIGTATMNVEADWDDTKGGYVITYDVPDMYKIDRSQGNGDAASFWNYDVETRALLDLASYGVYADSIVI